MAISTNPSRSNRPTRGEGPTSLDYASRLARQLVAVHANSAFYQRKFGRCNASHFTLVDLARMPFTTRAELQEDQLAHPPFGSYLAAPPDRIARVHRTSGTSGQPLFIALSARDTDTAARIGAACFQAAGVLGSDRIIHCLGYCLWSGGVTDHLALEQAGAGVIPFGAGQTTDLIRAILHLKPTGIHCTPSYLAKIEHRLEREFQMKPADLQLRIGLFGGEPGIQDHAFRRRIEQTWGFTAMDANYGMSEVLSIFGAECEARCGLHFMAAESLVAELKDVGSDDVLPWERGVVGELVLTHLQRECQPLVRYRTSDVIHVLGTDQCECGRTSPRFRVVGRVDDMVVVRGVNVFIGAIAEVVNRQIDELTGEFRFSVNRVLPITDCRLTVEVRIGRDPDQAVQALKHSIRNALSLQIDVEAAPAGSLPRTNGKTARLLRTL